MDSMQKLIELEELKNLKASYFYFLDTKDWTSWLDLFAPNATLKWDSASSVNGRDGQTGPVYTGRDQIEKHIVRGLDPAQTLHQGHTPLLELTSATTARGIWAMEDIVVRTDGSVHGFGHYRETYEKLHGQWKITSLHLTRLRVTTTSR
jgi:hypothetical protein